MVDRLGCLAERSPLRGPRVVLRKSSGWRDTRSTDATPHRLFWFNDDSARPRRLSNKKTANAPVLIYNLPFAEKWSSSEIKACAREHAEIDEDNDESCEVK